MPIVDITCSSGVTDADKIRLNDVLPHAVSAAVACIEEPYDGKLRRGDVLILFREAGPFDRFDLDVLIEVKSKWFPSRAADSQRRADAIREAVAAEVGTAMSVGVYLSLPAAAWSEGS